MIQVAQLLLSLSILVFFHELGHFTFAKIFKTRIEKFYLFFNPWFSIFKFKKGDTEYGVGWLPLGGYVKIAGMIDESMDKEQMKQPPKPWEFRSKPAWQRLLIMLAGVLVNFILAFIIYINVLAVWGEQRLPIQEINKYGIVVDSLGQELGFATGDKIIPQSEELNTLEAIYADLILSSENVVVVERNNEQKQIKISKEQISKILKNGPIFGVRIPFTIAGFADTSVAQEAGIKVDDQIVAINGKEVRFYDEVVGEMTKLKDSTATFSVLRNEKDTLNFVINVPSSGKIGVAIGNSLADFYEIETVRYSYFEAIPRGIKKTFHEVDLYLKQLKLIFTPKTKAYKSVGSFITIGKLFPKKWDWEVFWKMTALLSIMLGVVNLLPIPALDGGHVMFTLYEMIVGRKPNDKFLEIAQMIGMLLLLLLIIFAIGNDFMNHVF